MREFGSPVPAHTCIVSLGAMASMPIEMTRWLSNTGRHVTPLLVDFQMPPAAAAAKNVFDGDGIPVTSDMRPIVFAGPTFRQRNPAIVRESSSKGLDAGAWAAAADATSVAAATTRCVRIMIEWGGGRRFGRRSLSELANVSPARRTGHPGHTQGGENETQMTRTVKSNCRRWTDWGVVRTLTGRATRTAGARSLA